MYYNVNRGNLKHRAVNAEDVKEQITALMIISEDNADKTAVLEELLDIIDKLPTAKTADGKKLRRAYYPRIMVNSNFREGLEPIRVGDNIHHQLIIKHGKNCSFISFLDTLGMIGTDYADEGYSFVGTQMFEELGDDTEYVPFDEVWVKEPED